MKISDLEWILELEIMDGVGLHGYNYEISEKIMGERSKSYCDFSREWPYPAYQTSIIRRVFLPNCLEVTGARLQGHD
jgi:hypothetical protein